MYIKLRILDYYTVPFPKQYRGVFNFLSVPKTVLFCNLALKFTLI